MFKRTLRSSGKPVELADSAGGNPFGNEDVAIVVEAGIMGMDESAVRPLRWITANSVIAVSFNPHRIVSQAGHDIIVGIQNAYPGNQFGDDHQILPGVSIGGQAVSRQRFLVVSV